MSKKGQIKACISHHTISCISHIKSDYISNKTIIIFPIKVSTFTPLVHPVPASNDAKERHSCAADVRLLHLIMIITRSLGAPPPPGPDF